MKRTKAGFTLVEVVIAVTIAILTSAAAAAVILSTGTTSNNATERNNAVAQIGAVMECFKASENMTDFEKAVEFVYGVDAFTIDKEGCNTQAGCTLYFYLNEDGSLYKAGTETDTVNTSWDSSKTSSGCKYFLAVNISKCRSSAGGFNANTLLKAAVYKAKAYTGAEPVIDFTDSDNGAIYALRNPYKKGVSEA
jgi:type II secretory pathway pseudopilin PulG